MASTEDHILSSPHGEKEVPNCDLWTYIEESFIKKKNVVALVEPHRNISFTFGELHKKVECIASNLLALGYNRERPLVVYMNNCVEFVMAMLAVWRLGGRVATINHLLTVNEISKYLEILDSEFVLCNKGTASSSVKASLGSNIKTFICIDSHPGCVLFSTLYETPKVTSKFPKFIDPKDTAVMAFSSGTTGTPKCVEISHRGFAEVITGLVEASGTNKLSNGGILYQPLSHAYGVMIVLCFYRSGQKLIIMPQFQLEEFVSYIDQYKVEILFLVPPIAIVLAKTPLLERYDLSSVKIIMCGAAPLGKDSEEELRKRLQYKAKVIQAYGLTETSGGGCAVPHYDSSAPTGSVGFLYPNTKGKVVDIDTGKTLGPYHSGELCFKSNFIMNGYLRNPEATSNMIRDGWLHTGDIAYYDKNGYFFVVDRLKELIKYKAYQVAPSELESIILTHPGIADVGVTSVPDDEAGELPQAWVVLKPGVSFSEVEIQAFVADKVAPFKRLRGGVKFVEAIPKSPSGKIMRRLMKQQKVVSKL